MTINHYVYLQQLSKYLEVNLIGSKATNPKQEKIFFTFSCLGLCLNPRPLPCNCSNHNSSTMILFKCFQVLPLHNFLLKISCSIFILKQMFRMELILFFNLTDKKWNWKVYKIVQTSDRRNGKGDRKRGRQRIICYLDWKSGYDCYFLSHPHVEIELWGHSLILIHQLWWFL